MKPHYTIYPDGRVVQNVRSNPLGAFFRVMKTRVRLIGPMYRLNRGSHRHGISTAFAPHRISRRSVDV